MKINNKIQRKKRQQHNIQTSEEELFNEFGHHWQSYKIERQAICYRFRGFISNNLSIGFVQTDNSTANN